MVGEKANSTVDFKTISFEKITVWEIAVRKLDFSPVGIERTQRGRADCDDVKTSVFV